MHILYSADLVRKRRTTAIKGRLTPEQAAALLLTGSGVGYRVTTDGVFVLFSLPRREVADPGDGVISEVLVVGRRTQNADIPRTENDIQPYKVMAPRGVVNVVLKRDYRGADLTVVSGISSRGDAGQGRIEARLGFTPTRGAPT